MHAHRLVFLDDDYPPRSLPAKVHEVCRCYDRHGYRMVWSAWSRSWRYPHRILYLAMGILDQVSLLNSYSQLELTLLVAQSA